MAIDPAHLKGDGDFEPIARRPRERLAGGVFQAFTRVAGLRPEIVPDYFRRQLRLIGISDDQVNRVLPRMRSLAEWPYGWEAEGDACAAKGEWTRAFASYYTGQRILIAPTALKRRMYSLALDAYSRIQQPVLERFTVLNPDGLAIAGYLQFPEHLRDGERPPVVLMVPGVAGTKEELHKYCMPLLKRGIAIARIDNPVYGETEGVLDITSLTNARHVVEHLAKDPRLDPAQIHLHGMSLGAHFALHSALDAPVASVTVICPPYAPASYFPQLPTLNLTALQHMSHRRDLEELLHFVRELSLEKVAPKLTMPIRIFHGGRDRTIPVSEAHALAADAGGPTAVTIYERDHHNCNEHIDEIAAQTLEFLRDPVGTCERMVGVERIDGPATIHVTDDDARGAGAGSTPRRRIARLPFLVPGAKPGPQRSIG